MDARITELMARLTALERERAEILPRSTLDDVLRALEAGRSPVVITERTAHLEIIAKRLKRFARHVIILRGGQSEKQRRDSAARLAAIP